MGRPVSVKKAKAMWLHLEQQVLAHLRPNQRPEVQEDILATAARYRHFANGGTRENMPEDCVAPILRQSPHGDGLPPVAA